MKDLLDRGDNRTCDIWFLSPCHAIQDVSLVVNNGNALTKIPHVQPSNST